VLSRTVLTQQLQVSGLTSAPPATPGPCARGCAPPDATGTASPATPPDTNRTTLQPRHHHDRPSNRDALNANPDDRLNRLRHIHSPPSRSSWLHLEPQAVSVRCVDDRWRGPTRRLSVYLGLVSDTPKPKIGSRKWWLSMAVSLACGLAGAELTTHAFR